ncbi:MAG TPA: ANTAR domain-containing protein [Pseudonocardia sp.]|jgi:hypothetical protein|uniref:ANTAR domain-containing protein n=1 Tax=Pseudonocardia sp. TaxID=60912 RepID=UPI002B4B6B97|nr:ANTAR domain-containing protein [Pseudonocardia sp.]HLU56109.1 ANTAR domain-containing protein [Pseudonocardia sp.]
MRHRDQRSELAPAPSGGPGPAPALVAREPIIDALHQVISDLFAVGLQLHLTVGDFDPDSEAAQRLRAALKRLDEVLATLRWAIHLHPPAEPAAGVADWRQVAQAEGVIAERHGVPVADAVTALAAYARERGERLPDVARAVLDGDVDIRPD